MCNLFIENFVDKIIEEIEQKSWLWAYQAGVDDDRIEYLIIKAQNRKDAIWKLKIASDPYIGHKYISPMNNAYGLNLLFHAVLFCGNFNNYNMDKVEKEEFVEAFESRIKFYGEDFQLLELDNIKKI